MLQYYDVKKPVVLTCDASKSGLGASCLQEERPIAYASRAMTDTEQRYAQIEKELLAVTFACKRFHDYIYGRPVKVETDHQPLITIMKKPLHAAPFRLQKLMMQLQRYDLDVVYKRGKELYVADTLSRAYLTEEDTDEEEWYDVMCVLPVSERRKEELLEELKKDSVCQQLKETILNGWPKHYKSVPAPLRPYFTFRDELAIQEGLIMKGHRVIIPASLQSDYIKELHKGHPGIEATKARSRETVYWPSISSDIEDTVAACSPCNALKPRQQKEPLTSYETPELPFQIVGSDLFEHQRQTYMVTVDSYSGFYEIDHLKDMTSKTIIQKMKKLFAVHGTPQTLITDNASYYMSNEFKQFMKEWQIEHKTSSPTYAQSNGLSERAVRSAKTLLEKCSRDGTDPYMALLHVRNTPRGELGTSAQRLFSRRTRTTLPMTTKLLIPAVIKDVKSKLAKVRGQNKKHFDKSARPLPKLHQNDIVRMETAKGFDKLAKVISSAYRPKSYVVEADGRLYERNRKHLLAVKESAPQPMAETPNQSAKAPIPPQTAPMTPPRPPKQQGNVMRPPPPVDVQHPQKPAVPVMPAPQTPRATVTRSGRISKPNPIYSDYTK